MENGIKTTPLNQWHRNHGARMADFRGHDMPLWHKTGVKKEHLAVIESVGLFDASHMASVMVEGNGALSLLQYCQTRDLSGLKDGRCVYGAILNRKGHVIDDAIVYRFRADRFMVCVNAGMGETVTAHLSAHINEGDATLTDLSGKLGKVDVQGQNSARALKAVIKESDAVFESMPYFSFKGRFDDASSSASSVCLASGAPILLSRSGYTGEFGFEIFIDASFLVSLWEDILKAGEPFHITPCGLGARDSLRGGAVLPLSQQDVGPWKFMNHPWMFALPLKPDGKGFVKSFLGDRHGKLILS